MTILRRKVRPYGNGAHIILPRGKVGEEAVIVYEDDLEEFKTVIRTAYLYSSVYDKKIADLKFDLDDIKARVGFIERFLPKKLAESP